MAIDINLDAVGNFTWLWGQYFFIETNHNNYVWSDPEYGGDDTIRPYDGSLEKFCNELNIPLGRDKGRHVIRDYCGDDVQIVRKFFDA